MTTRFKVIIVAGARPNFMKIAPLVAQFKKNPKIALTIVHTGQHYDEKMSKVFFDELQIPRPDINLGVGSGTNTEQTAKVMLAFEPILQQIKPDLVIVVGDVNSTVACGLVAKKYGVKLAHVEAGLRSFDWDMPEEINRIITDRISDFMFCTEESAVKNLKNEGVPKSKIFFVGNVMIDTLLGHKKQADKSKVLSKLGLEGKTYAVLTLHRPSNVDSKENLAKAMSIARNVAKKLPVIFPIHPRTQKNIKNWNISMSGITVTEPLGYLDFLNLMSHCSLTLTDSGGIQEETTVLGVPCLTLRNNTERPVTVSEGTNRVVGMNEKKILSAVSGVLAKKSQKARTPKLWDGEAAGRITKILLSKLA